MIKYYNKIILSLSEVDQHPVLLIHGLTGCAFHCFHCFNYDELISNTPHEYYQIEDVVKTIKQQENLFDYIIFSGGEFMRAPLDALRHDLAMVKATSAKPIIVYTTGVEYIKMKTLFLEGLIDGFHVDMKLPYHLLNEEDFDLIELTMGITVTNLSLFDKLLDALEFTIAYDKGYNRIRSVRYPFISESAFEENFRYIYELNRRYGKNVPYDVNPFIYTDKQDNA
jgi:pyruvate-formate lyase-activating enzyme